MATKFHAPSPWVEIKAAAQGAKSYIAVPFLGKGAAELLSVAADSVLVTRFTREAVRAAQVDPSEVVKFIRRGVSVFNQEDLHAKIYVFPRKAFVGSANASKTSQRLVEACIETTDSDIVRQARDQVRSLASDLITLEYAKSLIPLYPKDGERYFGVPKRTAERRAQEKERFWICPLHKDDIDDHAVRADRLGVKVARATMAADKSTKLDKIFIDGRVPFKESDWLLQRFNSGRGYEFVCPARIVHIEPYRVGRASKAVVYLDVPKRQPNVSSTEVRASLPNLVSKLCYATTNDRQLKAEGDVASVKRLWSAFRA